MNQANSELEVIALHDRKYEEQEKEISRLKDLVVRAKGLIFKASSENDWCDKGEQWLKDAEEIGE